MAKTKKRPAPQGEVTFMPRGERGFIKIDVQRSGRCVTTEDMDFFAEQLTKLLNEGYHHNGIWLGVWGEPSPVPTRSGTGVLLSALAEELRFEWWNPEGRLIFRYRIDDDFDTILTRDPKHWIGGCELAWAQAEAQLDPDELVHLDAQWLNEQVRLGIVAPLETTSALAGIRA